MGGACRPGNRPQQGWIFPADSAFSGARSGFGRARRTRRRRRAPQQCAASPWLRLGDFRRGTAAAVQHLSGEQFCGCSLRAGRCRAEGRVRRGGRSLRVGLLPHVSLPAAGLGGRRRRALPLRGLRPHRGRRRARDPGGLHRPDGSRPKTPRRFYAREPLARRWRDPDLSPFLHFDPAPARACAGSADVS